MRSDRFKAVVGSESLLSAAMVVACFGCFLAVVNLTFPEGLRLGAMSPTADRAGGDAASSARRIDLSVPGGGETLVARLERVVRKVKTKAPEAIAWQDARVGVLLGDQHSVQTLSGSEATLSFGPGNTLVLGENSLIVLKALEGESDGAGRSATVQMVGGELRGGLRSGSADGLHMVVETPSGRAQVEPGRGATALPAFRVHVDQDRRSTISVFQGTAQVTSGGRTVQVPERHGLSIDASGSVDAPRSLPDAPELREPAADSRITAAPQALDVEFRWGKVKGADEYRFAIEPEAGTAGARQERILKETKLVLSDLGAGSWRWTVASRKAGFESAPPPARRLELVLDETLRLEVAWPEEVVRDRTLLLTGRAAAGARVFANKVPGKVDDSGRFRIHLHLERGANRIVVESVDEDGHSTRQSRVIKASF
jgi:hypothetical protein